MEAEDGMISFYEPRISVPRLDHNFLLDLLSSPSSPFAIIFFIAVVDVVIFVSKVTARVL